MPDLYLAVSDPGPRRALGTDDVRRALEARLGRRLGAAEWTMLAEEGWLRDAVLTGEPGIGGALWALRRPVAPDPPTTVGAWVRGERVRRGWTLRRLADEAVAAGGPRVSRMALSQLERDVTTRPRPPLLAALRTVLGPLPRHLEAIIGEDAA